MKNFKYQSGSLKVTWFLDYVHHQMHQMKQTFQKMVLFLFSGEKSGKYLFATLAMIESRLSPQLRNTFMNILVLLHKGKADPLQAWSDPEGSRKLRFPYFMTTAQDGGKVVSLTHRPPLPPGNTPGTHFC